MSTFKKVLKFSVRPVLYGLLLGALAVSYVNLKTYYEAKIRNPGIIKIQDYEMEAICIMKEPLAVQYYGDRVVITAFDCNGEPFNWVLPHPKPGTPV